jgi:hypothetical protein
MLVSIVYRFLRIKSMNDLLCVSEHPVSLYQSYARASSPR